MANRKYPCYIQKKDNRGQWYWIYYAKNYEEISRSSESYINKVDCENSIRLMKESANSPTYTEG